MGRFRNSDDVYAYLNGFLNMERKLDPVAYRLDRMRQLRDLFGRPDSGMRLVHVAGSKGKGSTATMLAAILQRHDPPVGLYTSPHLLSFTERIGIAGAPVRDDVLLPAATELASGIESRVPSDYPGGDSPTYFELLTLLAFLSFRRAGCGRAVIEVGLGGRLDSTNVIQPEACVITPIELEHTEILGDTIPKIASEKAGIIKPGIPVYVSALRPDALDVIRSTARGLDAPVHVLDDEISITDLRLSPDGTEFTLSPKDASWSGLRLRTPLVGTVQARNAAVAALCARGLGVDDDTIRRGLAEARLSARFEIMRGTPDVILDGAHTPDSVAACASDFKTVFGGRAVLLFGCAKDKNPEAMADALSEVASMVVVTKPGTFKESDLPRITKAFEERGYSVRAMEDTRQAVQAAMDTAVQEGLPLLVTGSFYLCAEAAMVLKER